MTDRARPFADWPRPLAFVLSGGGAMGSVQVGMLRALTEAGVRPDLIVGSSVGALNGVVYADDPARAVDRLEARWRLLDRRAVFGRNPLTGLWSLARRGHLARPDRLLSLIGEQVAAEEFADLRVPFAAVATEVLTGEPELLSSGPLRPALLASSAVPGVFPEVRIGEHDYVDGGLSANVPIRQAVAFGARSAVVLDVNPPTFATRLPRSLPARAVVHVNSMLRNQRSDAVDELRGRIPMVTVPTVIPPDFGTFNFERTDELLAESHSATRDFLADLTARGQVSTDL